MQATTNLFDALAHKAPEVYLGNVSEIVQCLRAPAHMGQGSILTRKNGATFLGHDGPLYFLLGDIAKGIVNKSGFSTLGREWHLRFYNESRGFHIIHVECPTGAYWFISRRRCAIASHIQACRELAQGL